MEKSNESKDLTFWVKVPDDKASTSKLSCKVITVYLLFQFPWSIKLFLSVKTSISVSPKETLLPRPKKLLNDLKAIIHGPESMDHPKWWGVFGVTFSQFSSVQSCLTLCYPMNHSTPVLPVHHQLRDFTQTHVHRVGDAIQPSHPLSCPQSLPASESFPMSQLFA